MRDGGREGGERETESNAGLLYVAFVFLLKFTTLSKTNSEFNFKAHLHFAVFKHKPFSCFKFS